MTGRWRTARARTTAAGAVVTVILAFSGADAGDEDISPNAYQEFDPVTGYMITVDPDAENRQGHDRAAAQDADTSGYVSGVPPAEGSVTRVWLYGLVAALAAALFIVWVREKTRRNSPL